MRKLLAILCLVPALAGFFLSALACLLLPALAYGDPAADAELKQLQAALTDIQQEQQSLYQRFQMVQELRRTEMQDLNPPVIQNSPIYNIDSPQTNYDDLARAKREREDRIQQYTEDLNRLYARYRDLEDQKKALRTRMGDLVQRGTQ